MLLIGGETHRRSFNCQLELNLLISTDCSKYMTGFNLILFRKAPCFFNIWESRSPKVIFALGFN
jgi:hypothetical protein